MIGYKDLCMDCSALVGGGPTLMPHLSLDACPLEPEDRNSFRCRKCNCDWRVSLGMGWRRMVTPS
jgi:hypothetical protein